MKIYVIICIIYFLIKAISSLWNFYCLVRDNRYEFKIYYLELIEGLFYFIALVVGSYILYTVI
jgi:hypothetical protein